MRKWPRPLRVIFILVAAAASWWAIAAAGCSLSRALAAPRTALDAFNRAQNLAHRPGDPAADPPGDVSAGWDCKDYALAKRQALGRGQVLWVQTEQGVDHAVLEIDTPEGARILDNRFDRAMAPAELRRLGYVIPPNAAERWTHWAAAPGRPRLAIAAP